MDRASVMVVDDEKLVRGVLRGILEYQGFNVLEAEDGDAAVQMSVRGPVDLVVLDLSMPGGGGVQALRRLRAARPGLPVLVLSGHHEDEARDQLGGLDVSGYVQKPFQMRTMVSEVHRCLAAS